MEDNDYRYDGDEPVKEMIRRFFYVIAVCIASIIGCVVICSFFSSCSAPRETSYIEQHRVERMMDRMDSVINTKTVIQQDSTWRETIMKQFQSIREKSDTSHTLVLDTAGNVLKEKIIINNIRETTSETDRKEMEVMKSRLDVMDQTLDIMRQNLSIADSLLQSKNETVIKEVEKDLSWWQQARIWLGNLVLVALAIAAAIWAVKKRIWWLTLIRKVI